jgi:hypothetical protein
MLCYKFGIEAGFGIVGTISYGLVPLCTYILFNVNFLKITLVNFISCVLFIIQFGVNGSSKEDEGGKLAILAVSYLVIIVGITIICCIIGLWQDKASR